MLWASAAVWVVLAIFGAENFQELYGGTSGAQFFLFAFIIALPTAIGWWAHRRSRSRRAAKSDLLGKDT
jgi:membrane protein DedA with SNARE-associated domain